MYVVLSKFTETGRTDVKNTADRLDRLAPVAQKLGVKILANAITMGAYDVVTVPGALEIPQAIVIALDAAHDAEAYHGVVALGCVIRGETSHYDIVAGESARALMEIGVGRKIPIGNGILTVDTAAQAKVRAALDKGDKGGTAAKAALSLVRLKRGLATSRKPR